MHTVFTRNMHMHRECLAHARRELVLPAVAFSQVSDVGRGYTYSWSLVDGCCVMAMLLCLLVQICH